VFARRPSQSPTAPARLILGTGSEIGLTRLALPSAASSRETRDVALLRAYTAVRVVEAHPRDGTSESMLEHVGEALGVPISMVASAPQGRLARPRPRR